MNRLIFTLAVALLVTGCAGGPRINLTDAQQMIGEAKISRNETYLTDDYRENALKDERGSVLHHLRIGLAALQKGNRTLAGESFDAALVVIEAIYGDDETAKEARQIYKAESDKVFRGEPYERAMAYYYRGVLYLMDSDYENARASFRSAFLQDSLAGNQVHQQDFAMLAYLEGWASQCNGDISLAQQAFEGAQKYKPDLTPPTPDADVLVLAEHGRAPVKYTEGQYNQFLKIRPNTIRPGGNFYAGAGVKPDKLPNTESVAYQAITRGGRQFDAILKGQAQFKKDAKQAADTALVVAQSATNTVNQIAQSGAATSASVAQATGFAAVGLAAIIYGSVKESQARKANPTADSRQWDNLPENVDYGAYSRANTGDLRYGNYGVDQSSGSAQVVFQPLAGSREHIAIQNGGDNRCEVKWARLAAEETPADNIPPFMKKMNGCWDNTLFSGPGGAWIGEYKVINGNTFLHRKGSKIIVMNYRVADDNSFVITKGSYAGDPSSYKWKVRDNKFGGMNKKPAEKCGGLLLQ